MAPIEPKFNRGDRPWVLVTEYAKAKRCPTCKCVSLSEPTALPRWVVGGVIAVEDIEVRIGSEGVCISYENKHGLGHPWRAFEEDCFATEAEARDERDRRNKEEGG